MPRLAWGGEVVFEGLRFRLDPGRWTCLLGPSGVGKTTLLRLIAGLGPGALVATDDGRPLDDRIALMAQQDLLLPWLSARDNVLLGPRLRRAGGARMAGLRDGPTPCWPASSSRITATSCRRSCRAACASASPSPAPSWRTGPSC